MKNFSTILIAFFISIFTYGQYFEGEIIYKNTYNSKIPSLSDEKLTSLMGSTQDYFIKKNSYKLIFDGTFLQWQLYIPAENKMYAKMSNNEAAQWTDAGINLDSVISVDLNKHVLDILGYPCDELVLNCKSGTQKYYFDSKLSLDSKMFINHKYGNWYTFVSKSNAVPLKTIVDNAQFTITSIAVEVKPLHLEDNIFKLPSGIQVQRSSYE